MPLVKILVILVVVSVLAILLQVQVDLLLILCSAVSSWPHGGRSPDLNPGIRNWPLQNCPNWIRFWQIWGTSFRYHKQNKRISVFSWLRLRGMREMNPQMDPTVENSVIFHLIHPWILTWNLEMKRMMFLPFQPDDFQSFSVGFYSLTSPFWTGGTRASRAATSSFQKGAMEDSTVRCSWFCWFWKAGN